MRCLAEDVCRELSRYFIRPLPHLAEREAYTVFCLESPLATAGQLALQRGDWLHAHRREVAALLTQEPDLDHLSEQETDESTSRHLSYYKDDLVVVDWDAALIIDQSKNFDETLYLMELANYSWRSSKPTTAHSMIRSNAPIAICGVARFGAAARSFGDFARFASTSPVSAMNFRTSPIFRRLASGPLYQSVSSRFHLADWHRTIDEKLKTLDNFYQLLQHDRTNRWMLILETTIVLLFIIDLVLSGARPEKH
jgi:hypothetical protein